MRQFFQSTYLFSLRACGLLGIGFAVMLLLGLPGAFLNDMHVLLPLVGCLCGLGCSLVCAFSRLRPRWATAPRQITHGLGLFFIVGPFFVPIMLLPLAAVIVWDVVDPMGKVLAMSGALLIVLPAQLVQWLGLILGCWPEGRNEGRNEGRKQRKTEAFVPRQPVLGADDLRALRLSRMQN